MSANAGPLLEKARRLIGDARRLSVLTGAGISAESGIPTFRGPGGVWRQYRPENLATPEAFALDPRLVWEWYDWRRQRIAAVAPNAGHRALAAMERGLLPRQADGFTLVTQNVDGLHDRAGSLAPVKLHGDIWDLRCTRCSWSGRDDRAPLPELPPRCACGAMLRPGVVWFGEALPPAAWRKAEQAAREADLLLVVGTSAVVYPAAGLIEIARNAGRAVIEVNIEPTRYSQSLDVFLPGKAGEILPLLAPASGQRRIPRVR